MATPLRALVFSTLYPSSVREGHGIFVETRLRELLRRTDVQARVVAPVPWFPLTDPRWGEWALMAETPRHEVRHGIEVHHPRYALPPKVGMTIAPLTLALAALPTLRRLRREGFDFDLIDAHYFYPDGVAAALLGRWLQRPVAITARGSDLNLIPQHTLPRRMMQWAGRQAAASIGVSQALADVLHRWALPAGRVHVVRNGVDLERFAPMPRMAARALLGLSGGPWLLSVGNLVELKGHDLVIAALADLRRSHPDARLAIVGRGPERERLEQHAARLGVREHVHFAGAVPQAELPRWYSAADVMLLASSREGMANVLLECMACDTPLVATRVGGNPEVLGDAGVGRCVGERTPQALVAAVRELLAQPPAAGQVRAHAERFGWAATSAEQLRLFRAITGRADTVPMEPRHA